MSQRACRSTIRSINVLMHWRTADRLVEHDLRRRRLAFALNIVIIRPRTEWSRCTIQSNRLTAVAIRAPCRLPKMHVLRAFKLNKKRHRKDASYRPTLGLRRSVRWEVNYFQMIRSVLIYPNIKSPLWYKITFVLSEFCVVGL